MFYVFFHCTDNDEITFAYKLHAMDINKQNTSDYFGIFCCVSFDGFLLLLLNSNCFVEVISHFSINYSYLLKVNPDLKEADFFQIPIKIKDKLPPRAYVTANALDICIACIALVFHHCKALVSGEADGAFSPHPPFLF